ncbi:ABC transporter substrate-binding protein [Paenibacillus caui]|uniref:ABC transporter substrate-binding protein n=1 Tax=Paenibacillus caui TaxID=2873927 RepID=UPI001CA943BD|nr:Fe(3+) dicitrate ABC transporter substrate-binding protein [Paenibacillus caui]
MFSVERKRGAFVFCVMLVAAIIMSACGSNGGNASSSGKDAAPAGSKEIQHEAGKTVVPAEPKRIVVLEFSFVDALWQLGIKPVGIAHENKDDIDLMLGQKIDYTSVGTRAEPSLETISTLKPDLIIADQNRHEAIYKDLSAIAPTLILKSRNASYEEVISAFQTIAEAVGKKEEGSRVLEEHRAKLEKLKAEIPANENRKVLVGVFRSDSLSAHGAKSFDGNLLELMNIPNAIQNAPGATAKISLEQLVEWNPDVIFMAEADDDLLNEWSKNPLWQNIDAVKNKQVFEVNRSLWTRFRGLDSAEKIAQEAIDHLYPKG